MSIHSDDRKHGHNFQAPIDHQRVSEEEKGWGRLRRIHSLSLELKHPTNWQHYSAFLRFCKLTIEYQELVLCGLLSIQSSSNEVLMNYIQASCIGEVPDLYLFTHTYVRTSPLTYPLASVTTVWSHFSLVIGSSLGLVGSCVACALV